MPITLNLSIQRSSGALILNLAPPGDARTATISGRTRTTGHAILGVIIEAAISGRTSRTRGYFVGAYDPNLLSATTGHQTSEWTDGLLCTHTASASWSDGLFGACDVKTAWTQSGLAASDMLTYWNDAGIAADSAHTSWDTKSDLLSDSSISGWQDAAFAGNGSFSEWNEAALSSFSTESFYRPILPLFIPERVTGWNDGLITPYTIASFYSDGTQLDVSWKTAWQDAGLAYNAWQPPWIKPPAPKPSDRRHTILNLRKRRSGPLILNLGSSEYILWDVADLRYYHVLNSCSVVRLPERTELPVTSVTVETDADSWGWSVSLNLAGADGWALCQPYADTGFPREVEITINGTVWTAVLDDPQLSRVFGSHRITAKGTSRSAWLTTPFAPSTTVAYDSPRSGQQVAEEALDSTGWSLDWRLPLDPDWLIPADHYARTGTALERLVALVAAVKGCLYSDPEGYGFIAYPRYPVLPWDWDDAVIDVNIPEAALISWNQQSQNRPSVNRVYVSGTTSGVLMQLTKEGTAGDLCASDPIVDALLTDAAAARARAEAELASGGPGYQVSVETVLGGTGDVPLIRPGLLCSFAGIRGVVRSCSVSAARSGSGLAVRQGLTIERRNSPWL